MNPATRELYASIAVALARLSEPRVSDESVHEARKALKKARAALRLLRPALDPAAYRAQNALLRDAGRALAPLREQKSLLEALGALRRRVHAAPAHAALERLTQRLRAEKAAAARDRAGRQAALGKCVQLLKHSLERAEQPDFAGVGKRPLAKGMRRIYRKGRRALDAARASRAPGALHEWRKQAKYLLNALEVLYGGGGKARKIARRAERLSDRLGDDHDLDVLAARARGEKALQAAITRRRGRLQERAFALGTKLYAEKPKRFVRSTA